MKAYIWEISNKKPEEIRKIKNNKTFENLGYENRKKKIKKKIKYNQRKNNFLLLDNIYKNYFYICIFFFISNYLQISLLKTVKIRKLDPTSDITITIRGTEETQKILSDSYSDSLPLQVLINNSPTSVGKTVSGLTQNINNITMIWEYGISNCN